MPSKFTAQHRGRRDFRNQGCGLRGYRRPREPAGALISPHGDPPTRRIWPCVLSLRLPTVRIRTSSRRNTLPGTPPGRVSVCFLSGTADFFAGVSSTHHEGARPNGDRCGPRPPPLRFTSTGPQALVDGAGASWRDKVPTRVAGGAARLTFWVPASAGNQRERWASGRVSCRQRGAGRRVTRFIKAWREL